MTSAAKMRHALARKPTLSPPTARPEPASDPTEPHQAQPCLLLYASFHKTTSLAHYEGAVAVRLCAGHGLCGEPAAGSVPRQLGWDSHFACVLVQGELQQLCETAEGSMLKGFLSLLCPAGCADLQMRRVCSALRAPLYCSLPGLAGTYHIMCRAVRAASVCAKDATAVGMQGPGKKWEHLETNHNSKVVRQPIHVRKGDTVQIIAGKDKGKIGEISQVRL